MQDGNKRNEKIYCYVDETGQDRLMKIERLSGKQEKKWQKTRNKERLKYISQIFDDPLIKKHLKAFYSVFQRAGKSYVTFTIYAVTNILTQKIKKSEKVNIMIDAFNKNEQRKFSGKLRQFGLPVDKVRGGRDQSDPLLRLADALVGFVRDGIEGHSQVKLLFSQLKRNELISEVS